jgi:prefoldin subunit 5
MSLETYWLITPIILLGLSGLGWLWLWFAPRHSVPAIETGQLLFSPETPETEVPRASATVNTTVENYGPSWTYLGIGSDVSAAMEARAARLDSERAAEAISWLEKQAARLDSERAELWQNLGRLGKPGDSRRVNANLIRWLEDRVARLDSDKAKLRERIAERTPEVIRWLEMLVTEMEPQRTNLRESIERLTPKSGERGDPDVLRSLETRAARLDAERADLRDQIDQLKKRATPLGDRPRNHPANSR